MATQNQEAILQAFLGQENTPTPAPPTDLDQTVSSFLNPSAGPASSFSTTAQEESGYTGSYPSQLNLTSAEEAHFDEVYDAMDYPYKEELDPERDLFLEQKGTFANSFSSGVLNMTANAKYFGALWKDLTGDTEGATAAIAGAELLQEEAGYRISAGVSGPSTWHEFMDEPDVGNFLTMALSNIGQFAPSAIASIIAALTGTAIGAVASATAGVTAPVAAGLGIAAGTGASFTVGQTMKFALKRFFQNIIKKKVRGDKLSKADQNLLQKTYNLMKENPGAVTGAFGQEFMQGAGIVYGDFAEQDMRGPRQAAISLGGGAAYGIIGVPAEALVVASVLDVFKERAGKSFFKNLARDMIIKGGGRSLLGEGITEFGQEGVSILQKFQIDEDYTRAQAKIDAIDALMAGAIGGFGIGVAGGGSASIVRQSLPRIKRKAQQYTENVAEGELAQEFDKGEYGFSLAEAQQGYNSAPEPEQWIRAQYATMKDPTVPLKDAMWVAHQDPERILRTVPSLRKDLEKGDMYQVIVPGQGVLYTTHKEKADQLQKFVDSFINAGAQATAFPEPPDDAQKQLELNIFELPIGAMPEGLDQVLADILDYSNVRNENDTHVIEIVNEEGFPVHYQSTSEEGYNDAAQKAREIFGDMVKGKYKFYQDYHNEVNENGSFSLRTVENHLQERNSLFSGTTVSYLQEVFEGFNEYLPDDVKQDDQRLNDPVTGTARELLLYFDWNDEGSPRSAKDMKTRRVQKVMKNMKNEDFIIEPRVTDYALSGRRIRGNVPKFVEFLRNAPEFTKKDFDAISVKAAEIMESVVQEKIQLNLEKILDANSPAAARAEERIRYEVWSGLAHNQNWTWNKLKGKSRLEALNLLFPAHKNIVSKLTAQLYEYNPETQIIDEATLKALNKGKKPGAKPYGRKSKKEWFTNELIGKPISVLFTDTLINKVTDLKTANPGTEYRIQIGIDLQDRRTLGKFYIEETDMPEALDVISNINITQTAITEARARERHLEFLADGKEGPSGWALIGTENAFNEKHRGQTINIEPTALVMRGNELNMRNAIRDPATWDIGRDFSTRGTVDYYMHGLVTMLDQLSDQGYEVRVSATIQHNGKWITPSVDLIEGIKTGFMTVTMSDEINTLLAIEDANTRIIEINEELDVLENTRFFVSKNFKEYALPDGSIISAKEQFAKRVAELRTERNWQKAAVQKLQKAAVPEEKVDTDKYRKLSPLARKILRKVPFMRTREFNLALGKWQQKAETDLVKKLYKDVKESFEARMPAIKKNYNMGDFVDAYSSDRGFQRLMKKKERIRNRLARAKIARGPKKGERPTVSTPDSFLNTVTYTTVELTEQLDKPSHANEVEARLAGAKTEPYKIKFPYTLDKILLDEFELEQLQHEINTYTHKQAVRAKWRKRKQIRKDTKREARKEETELFSSAQLLTEEEKVENEDTTIGFEPVSTQERYDLDKVAQYVSAENISYQRDMERITAAPIEKALAEGRYDEYQDSITQKHFRLQKAKPITQKANIKRAFRLAKKDPGVAFSPSLKNRLKSLDKEWKLNSQKYMKELGAMILNDFKIDNTVGVLVIAADERLNTIPWLKDEDQMFVNYIARQQEMIADPNNPKRAARVRGFHGKENIIILKLSKAPTLAEQKNMTASEYSKNQAERKLELTDVLMEGYGHELGHILLDSESQYKGRQGAQAKLLMKDSDLLREAYKRDIQKKDAPVSWKGPNGPDEWFADKTAVFATRRMLSAKNGVESQFKRLANVLREAYAKLAKWIKARLGITEGYPLFEKWANGVIEEYRNGRPSNQFELSTRHVMEVDYMTRELVNHKELGGKKGTHFALDLAKSVNKMLKTGKIPRAIRMLFMPVSNNLRKMGNDKDSIKRLRDSGMVDKEENVLKGIGWNIDTAFYGQSQSVEGAGFTQVVTHLKNNALYKLAKTMQLYTVDKDGKVKLSKDGKPSVDWGLVGLKHPILLKIQNESIPTYKQVSVPEKLNTEEWIDFAKKYPEYTFVFMPGKRITFGKEQWAKPMYKGVELPNNMLPLRFVSNAKEIRGAMKGIRADTRNERRKGIVIIGEPGLSSVTLNKELQFQLKGLKTTTKVNALKNEKAKPPTFFQLKNWKAMSNRYVPNLGPGENQFTQVEFDTRRVFEEFYFNEDLEKHGVAQRQNWMTRAIDFVELGSNAELAETLKKMLFEKNVKAKTRFNRPLWSPAPRRISMDTIFEALNKATKTDDQVGVIPVQTIDGAWTYFNIGPGANKTYLKEVMVNRYGVIQKDEDGNTIYKYTQFFDMDERFAEDLVVEKLKEPEKALLDIMMTEEQEMAMKLSIGLLPHRAKAYEVLSNEQLYEAGITLDPAMAIDKYYSQIIKKIEYEKRGGWSRIATLIKLLPVEQQYDAMQGARHALGKYDVTMSAQFRSFNSWLLLANITTLLAFATFASLPDFAGPILRSKEFRALKDAGRVLYQMAQNPAEARELAKEIGVVATEAMELMWIHAPQMDFLTVTPRKYSNYFFKYTGLEFFTKFTRYFAAGMGKRFLLRHADLAKRGDRQSIRFLRELNNIQPDHILEWEKVGFDFDRLDPEVSRVVRLALSRFVDESIIRPSAMERPVWASDPRFALVWQLKSFFYAYGKNIVGGVFRESISRYKETGGNPAAAIPPLMLMAATILPLTMLGWDLRERAKYALALAIPGVEADWDKISKSHEMEWGPWWFEVTDRAGVLGAWTIVRQMYEKQQWGEIWITPLLGPTAEKTEDILRAMMTDQNYNWNNLIPLRSQLPK